MAVAWAGKGAASGDRQGRRRGEGCTHRPSGLDGRLPWRMLSATVAVSWVAVEPRTPRVEIALGSWDVGQAMGSASGRSRAPARRGTRRRGVNIRHVDAATWTRGLSILGEHTGGLPCWRAGSNGSSRTRGGSTRGQQTEFEPTDSSVTHDIVQTCGHTSTGEAAFACTWRGLQDPRVCGCS